MRKIPNADFREFSPRKSFAVFGLATTSRF